MRVRLLAIAVSALISVCALSASCSIGAGTGKISGTLDAPDCWSGPFDLQPDFFAAVPYRDSLELRIQNGGDYETFSDGVSVLIDDVGAIRGTKTRPASAGAPGQAGLSLLGVEIPVGLPPSVVPPGVPISPDPTPPLVHVTLYLQRSCRTQNVALHAAEFVTADADGYCHPHEEDLVTCRTDPAADGGTSASDASTADASIADASIADASIADASTADASTSDASAPRGSKVLHSVITFDKLFDNNLLETSADKRQNRGHFHVYLVDPRDICPGGLGPPPPCRGELDGNFDFYFERGRPAQPFP